MVPGFLLLKKQDRPIALTFSLSTKKAYVSKSVLLQSKVHLVGIDTDPMVSTLPALSLSAPLTASPDCCIS